MGKTYNSKKEDIYKLYKTLFSSDLDYGKKDKILRSLFIGESWTWKVVKISKNVVMECIENCYKKPSHRFERHHAYKSAFANTADFMLKHNLLRLEEWIKYIDQYEETYLLTVEEHNNWKNISKDIVLYDIDPNLNLFLNKDRGWRHGKAEIDFLKSIKQTYNL